MIYLIQFDNIIQHIFPMNFYILLNNLKLINYRFIDLIDQQLGHATFSILHFAPIV